LESVSDEVLSCIRDCLYCESKFEYDLYAHDKMPSKIVWRSINNIIAKFDEEPVFFITEGMLNNTITFHICFPDASNASESARLAFGVFKDGLNSIKRFIKVWNSQKEHLSSIANSHKQIKSDYLVELTAIGPDGNYSEKSYLGLGDFVEGDVLGYDVAEECSPMSKDEAESLAKDVEYDLKNRNIKDVKVKVIESARKPRFGKAVKSSVENDIRKKFHDEMIDVIWNITEKYNSYGIPEFPREDDFQEILDECKRNAMWQLLDD
jgi:hypothetical protein